MGAWCVFGRLVCASSFLLELAWSILGRVALSGLRARVGYPDLSKSAGARWGVLCPSDAALARCLILLLLQSRDPCYTGAADRLQNFSSEMISNRQPIQSRDGEVCSYAL